MCVCLYVCVCLCVCVCVHVRVLVCLCMCVCVFSEGSNTLLLKNVELPCIIMVLKTKAVSPILPYRLLLFAMVITWSIHLSLDVQYCCIWKYGAVAMQDW